MTLLEYWNLDPLQRIQHAREEAQLHNISASVLYGWLEKASAHLATSPDTQIQQVSEPTLAEIKQTAIRNAVTNLGSGRKAAKVLKISKSAVYRAVAAGRS